MNKNKKVIITGASGLIGKEAIEPLLQAGFEIYGLTIEDSPGLSEINWIKCNLFDAGGIKKAFELVKPQYLLHFAWATTDDYLSSNINFDFLKSSLDLLKYFKENGGKRVVFAGTCFEYEFQNAPLKEDSALNPQTVYAKCKNYLRQLAELFCEQNGISFGWGRIFYVFGKNEHEKRLTQHLINSLQQNKEVIIQNGDLVRDYVYTKDIAGAFVKFLDSQVTGSVNISSAKPVSLKDYSAAIAKKLNKSDFLTIKYDPVNQPPVITAENARLLNEVGYKNFYSLDEAIDEII